MSWIKALLYVAFLALVVAAFDWFVGARPSISSLALGVGIIALARTYEQRA